MLNNPNRRRVQFSCGTELVTKQSMKAECDIHNIINQFKRTGIITHITHNQPHYQDLPDEMDYQSSLNLIMQADAAFDTLPSTVRRYFDNDPARLLAALGDPAMKDQLIELGVLKGPDNPQPPGNVAPANPPVPGLSTAPVLPTAPQRTTPPPAPPAAPPTAQ